MIIMVLNNHDLNQVTWEQRVLTGDPEFEASQDVPEFNYANYAESLGLKGIRVEKRENVGPGWDQAFASNRPVVLDILSDPDVPTIPPHISFEQMVNMSKTLLKGDPHEKGIIRQTFKDVMQSLFPNK